MSALENSHKMIQLDAIHTQEEIIQDKIFNKVKSQFDPRMRALFAAFSKLEAEFETLNTKYKDLAESCIGLYDELEASRHVFFGAYTRISEIEKKLS